MPFQDPLVHEDGAWQGQPPSFTVADRLGFLLVLDVAATTGEVTVVSGGGWGGLGAGSLKTGGYDTVQQPVNGGMEMYSPTDSAAEQETPQQVYPLLTLRLGHNRLLIESPADAGTTSMGHCWEYLQVLVFRNG